MSSPPAAVRGRFRLRALFMILLLSASGCSEPDRTAGPSTTAKTTAAASDTSRTAAGAPLRVIVRPEAVAFLPRNAEPVKLDRDIAKGLARYLKREYQPVVIPDYSKMIDALLDGKGDLIAAHFTVTAERARRVRSSLPYLHVD